MLHKSRSKCCVRAYKTFLDIELLLMHPYVVPKKDMLIKNYTTYESILNHIWENIIQHRTKYYTTFEKKLNNT